MQNYPIQLAAAIGASMTVNVQATYVYYESASAGGADTRIKVVTDYGDEFMLKVGQGTQLKKGYTRLYVSNVKGQGAIIGNLVLADEPFADNRVVGSVEVIDGGKNRTMAGNTFIGSVSIGATPGFNGAAQLFNPGASGVNLFVSSFSISSATTGNLLLLRAAVAPLVSSAGYGGNKRIGASAAASQLRYEGLAALPGGANMLQIMNGIEPFKFEFDEPLMIPPANGINIFSNQQNATVVANFEWHEESV